MQGPDRAGVPGAGLSAVAAGVGSGAQAPGTPGWWSCICPGKGAPSGVDLEGPPDPEAGGSGQVCVFRGVWVRYSVGGHGGHREGRGQVVPKENPLEETTAVDRVEDRSQEPEVAVMERRDPRAVGSRGAQEGRVVWPALSSCLLGGPGLDCALCHLWEGPATAVQRGYWGQLDGSVHFARPGGHVDDQGRSGCASHPGSRAAAGRAGRGALLRDPPISRSSPKAPPGAQLGSLLRKGLRGRGCLERGKFTSTGRRERGGLSRAPHSTKGQQQ